MQKLFGLLGEKLGHSFSPKIHHFIFKELNIDAAYNLYEVKNERLKDVIKRCKALNINGLNVTIPYKVDIMQFLDRISDEAKKIGAVNTVVFEDDNAVGYNTDYFGFGDTLRKNNIDVKNKNVIILGNGGAAKSVIQYFLDEHVKDIIIVSRNVEKTKNTCKQFKVIGYNEIDFLKNQDVVVNCTPCGMYPNTDQSPINKSQISKFNAAVDLIYNPKETMFLKHAKEQDIKAVNGMYMLISQAVKSEELWNNIKINDVAVDKIYNELTI